VISISNQVRMSLGGRLRLKSSLQLLGSTPAKKNDRNIQHESRAKGRTRGLLPW
jgi:hypothetical protein